jgi:hypothetical protein
MYVYRTHDYIRMEITVLYLEFHVINCRFNGRKYPLKTNSSCYFNRGIGEYYTIKSTIDAVKYSNTIQLSPFKCNHVCCYIVDNYHASNLQLNVQTIITDFEDAVRRAVTAVFGRHINHQGCF